MEKIERLEFQQRYKVSPTRFLKNYPDVCEYNGHVLAIWSQQKDSAGFPTEVVYSDNGEMITLDLSQHWERGPEEEITISREGIMNLIRGVYAQTEQDLEEYYACGAKALHIEKLPGETNGHFQYRKESLYDHEIRKCELFLGSVFSKYARVKAYYSKLHMTIEEIAKKMGDTPERVAAIVDRLGLNRTSVGQEDGLYDVDEDFINEDF